MAHVDNVLGLFEAIQSADISVYQQRCVAVRNRNASCMRCAQACTSGAISLEENRLVVTPSLCVGCGTCATACPTCALEAHRPNDAELQQAAVAAMRANDGVAVLACRRIVDAARNMLDVNRLVAVECLGRIEESLITSLVVEDRVVVLVRADCEQCDHAVGLKTAQSVVDTSNELLHVWHQDVPVRIADRFPSSVRAAHPKDYDEARRHFFFSQKESAKEAAVAGAAHMLDPDKDKPESPDAVPVMKVQDDGTLPHFIPDRRERLLDNLSRMGEPEDELIVTRLWGHVLIDPDVCSTCTMCATFCPTGALTKVVDDDGTICIDHYPGDCVLCRCCEDICPTGALTLYDEVMASDVLSGNVEHNVLPAPKYDMKSSTRTRNMFRTLLDCDDIYDR